MLAGAALLVLVAPPAAADPGSRNHRTVAAPVADRILGGDSSHRTSLEMRSVSSETFGAGRAKVHSYRARASVRLATGAAAVAPYAGLGLGLQLVAGEAMEAVRGPGVGVGSLDVGAGANAFLGLRIPMGLGAALFAEGRAGLANDVGRAQRDQLRIDGRGDYTGFAGLRWAF